MKRIILICHKDHLVSGSVRFAQQLFEQEFSVEIIPGDSNIHYIQTLIRIHSDAIFVLWQTEFLAPWLTSKGCKVAVFPMFDGCANAPDSYFKILDNTLLFNFSKGLHKKSVQAGVISYQLNWYPTKKKAIDTTAKQDRLFYWLRRPNSSLSESLITEAFSPYVEGIHIHDRPDAYQLSKFISRIPDDYTTTSNWFEDKKELLDLIASSKYYLAPRESEGIGMAFLEAMSNGCIVFANRNATHDQYIYHGHNGFLIDFESKDKALIKKQLKEAFKIIRSGKPIGENARKFVENGAPIWQEQSEKLMATLVTVDHAEPIEPSKKLAQIIGYFLAQTYYKSPRVYSFFAGIVLELGFFNDNRLKNPIKPFFIALKKIIKRKND